MTRFLRAAALAASAALCACNTISSESANLLSMYLENAAQYYDGRHYQRAIQQWDQALQLDPDNEKARLGQAMALYQMGTVDSLEAIEPLAEATRRIDAMREEDFGAQQWKIELATGLVHQRWCVIYERKLLRLAADGERGVPVDPATLETSRREFQRHLALAEEGFTNSLDAPADDPNDPLTCWLGLARTSAWRGDLERSLKYANLYLEQVVKSESFWTESAKRYPTEAPIYEAKRAGARLQEAETRDLMGAVLVKLGRADEAEKNLSRVIELFPERATAYLNRGVLRQDRGDHDLARSDFERFLAYTSLPETDPAILEATRRLAEVKARLAAEDAAGRSAPPR